MRLSLVLLCALLFGLHSQNLCAQAWTSAEFEAGLSINTHTVIQWTAGAQDGNYWIEQDPDPDNNQIGDPDWGGGDHPDYGAWADAVQDLLDQIDSDGDGDPDNEENPGSHTIANTPAFQNVDGYIPAGAVNIPAGYGPNRSPGSLNVDNGTGIVTYVPPTVIPFTPPVGGWDERQPWADNYLRPGIGLGSFQTTLHDGGTLTIQNGATLTFEGLHGIAISSQTVEVAPGTTDGYYKRFEYDSWHVHHGGALALFGGFLPNGEPDPDAQDRIYRFTHEGPGTTGQLVFHQNDGVNFGGAISTNQTLILDVENTRFSENYAYRYGGAINNEGTVTISDLIEFRANRAGMEGGAFYNGGTLTVNDGSMFDGNYVEGGVDDKGGAIYNGGSLTLASPATAGRYNDFVRNDARDGRGGAIYMADGSDATISMARFGIDSSTGGNTAASGGAIYNLGALTIQDKTYFGNNRATGEHGGAIYNYGGKASVTYSGTDMVMEGNTASQYGGAIYNHLGNITLKNVTFQSNQAQDGGAIYSRSATLDLTNVNFVNNTATRNGANIYLASDNGETTTNITVETGKTVGFSGTGQSIYFDNRTYGHTLDVNIVSGGELNMELPMLGGGYVGISKTTGLGTWKLGGATTLGTNAKVNIQAGTLELLNGATMTLGTGSTFTLAEGTLQEPDSVNAPGIYDLDTGAVLFSNGGNTIEASTINIHDTNTILGFNGANLNTTTASLTLTSNDKTLEMSDGTILIKGDIDNLDLGDILVDLGNGADVDIDNFQLFEGTDNAWEEYQITRSSSGMAKGLVFENDQIKIGAVASDGNVTGLLWTGEAEKTPSSGIFEWDVEDTKNWYGDYAGGRTYIFLAEDSVEFADTVPPTQNKAVIELAEDITVGDMTVTGTGYEFDFNEKDLTAVANTETGATGAINFGSAKLTNLKRRTITAADSITFKEGSNLEFDVAGQMTNSLNLTINAPTITFEDGSTISVSGVPIDGHTITLITTNTNGTFDDLQMENLDLVPAGSQERSTASGAPKITGLATNDTQNLLLYKSVNADTNTSLEWTGLANNRWAADTQTPQENWLGKVEGIEVTTFLDHDNVTFGDTYGAADTDVLAADKIVQMGRATGTEPSVVSVGDMTVTGTDYVFDFNATRAVTLQANAYAVADGDDIDSIGRISLGNATIKNFGNGDSISGEFVELAEGGILQVTEGAAMSAVDTLDLKEGSSIDFDLTNAADGDTFLTLTGDTVNVNSDIKLSNLDDTKAKSFSIGETVTLIDGTAGMVLNPGVISMVDPANAVLFERGHQLSNGIDLMFGVQKSADGFDLNLVAVNSQGPADLVWNGNVDSDDPNDPDGKNNTWNSNSTNKNWSGNIDGVDLAGVEFVNGTATTPDVERDSVTFDLNGYTTVDVNNGTNGTIYISDMTVIDGTGYQFDFNLGNGANPVISANGDVHLGTDTTFNIKGFTPELDEYGNALNETVLIESANGFTGTPILTVDGGNERNFITVTMDTTNSDEITVTAKLAWDETDPAKAHGNFEVNDEFTLGARLSDNNNSAAWNHALTKQGTGRLILTGNNTYSGPTNITAGQLQLSGNGSLSPSSQIYIAANAGLEFNLAGGDIISNTISGLGIVTQKSGAGTVTLTGNNTFTGTTTVESNSALYMNGNNSTSLVDVFGTFGGGGQIAGDMYVRNGGTFAPGSSGAGSRGIFTVDGKVTFESGSTYHFDYNKNSQTNDLLVIGTGTAGAVEIQSGARLDVNLTGEAKLGDKFHVIDAKDRVLGDDNLNDRISGTYFTPAGDALLFDVTGNFGTQFQQVINETGYWLTWAPVSPEFADRIPNLSPNAERAAEGVDKIAAEATANGLEEALYANEVYDALTSFTDDAAGQAAIANAFAQLHGEVYATSRFAVAQMQRNFQELMPTGREILKTGDTPKLVNLWGTLTGEMEARDNIGKYSGFDMSSTGFAVGADRMITPNYLVGAAIGYDLAHLNFDSINSKAQVDAFRTMLYSTWYNGTYHLDMYGGYSKNFNETERNIRFADFSATSRGEYNDDVATAGFELGRTSWYDKMFSITPSFGMHYIRVISPDVTETNGGGANLFVEGDDFQSLRMPIGVKVSGVFTGDQGTAGTVWVPEARIFYVREWLDDEAVAMTSFSDFRGDAFSFAAMSGKMGKDSGLFGVGLNVQFTEHWQLRFDYDFAVYQHMNTHAFSSTLGFNW